MAIRSSKSTKPSTSPSPPCAAPRGPKEAYCRHLDSARLQWERDGVLSFYRFELRGGILWADQTICVNDRVIRRERPVHVEQIRSAKLYELANLIEGRKYY